MAKKQQDDAQLANVKRDVARTPSLVQQDFASRQTLNTQQSQAGIIMVTQTRPIAVTFTLPQEHLPQIQVSMGHSKLAVRALAPDGKADLDEGDLLTIDSAIDATTGTIKLKAVLPNVDCQLWPGRFVNARLLVRTVRDVLAVPPIAVQHGPEGLYVYVIKAGGTVGRQAAQLIADKGQISVVADATRTKSQTIASSTSPGI
jgi:membrane fusion protein, multidrug efflux system